MTGPRRIFQKFLKKQSGKLPKKKPVEILNAFYEDRIAKATSAQDLLALRKDILNHDEENTRYRRAYGLFTHTALLVTALSLGAAGALGAAALTADVAATGGGFLIAIVLSLASFVVGSLTLDFSKLFLNAHEEQGRQTQTENNALAGLSKKVQKKMTLAGIQSPAEKTSPSLLKKLRSVFTRASVKPAAPAANSPKTNSPAAQAS